MQKLIDRISSDIALRNAWDKLNKSNPESHGHSGLSIKEFRDSKEDRILQISQKLRKGTYKFSPNRAIAILKSSGKKYRPLQVPEIDDRLVLKSIALELEKIFSPLLDKSKEVSFAYQKNSGVKESIKKIEEIHNAGNEIVLETDIVNFFGEVDQKELLNSHVFPMLPDRTIDELLIAGLHQKLIGVEDLSPEEQNAFKGLGDGIPQGNPLSPLMSNIYLAPFDQFMIKNKYNLVRYADDFVVLGNSEEVVQNAFVDAKEFLKQELDLDLYDFGEDKTKIGKIGQDRFIFLSVEFDGQDFFPCPENYREFKHKLRTLCRTATNKMNVIEFLTKMRNRTEGWVANYSYTDVDRYLEELDYYIDRKIFTTLRKFGWKLANSDVSELPYKYRYLGSGRGCLSRQQRKTSGISLCTDILRSIRDKSQKEKNI